MRKKLPDATVRDGADTVVVRDRTGSVEYVGEIGGRWPDWDAVIKTRFHRLDYGSYGSLGGRLYVGVEEYAGWSVEMVARDSVMPEIGIVEEDTITCPHWGAGR